jgi:hypothetical protein
MDALRATASEASLVAAMQMIWAAMGLARTQRAMRGIQYSLDRP